MLIIKCQTFLSSETLDSIRKRIKKEAEEGTIVLPHYLDVIQVPDDVEIMFEDEVIARKKEKMMAIMKEDGTIVPLCENCQFKQCWGKIGETIRETFAEEFEKLVLNGSEKKEADEDDGR
jgi:hypothetical protein